MAVFIPEAVAAAWEVGTSVAGEALDAATVGSVARGGLYTGAAVGPLVGRALSGVDGYNNRIASGPERYADQFSADDTRIQLKNWEDDQKSIPVNSPAWGNIQSYIDALRAHLARLTDPGRNRVPDHPTTPAPPPRVDESVGGYVLTTLTAPVLDPLERAVDGVEHGLGVDLPLAPGAYHRTWSDGPDPVGRLIRGIRYGSWTNPVAVIWTLWEVTVETFRYVIWDVEEFVRLFRAWNGSLLMLTGHPQYLYDLVWRSLVTGLLAVGLVELAPLLSVMTQWTRWMVDVVWATGRWLVDTVGNGLSSTPPRHLR